MIEADVPSTEEVVCTHAERARPTGGSHGLTTRGPVQRTIGKSEGRAPRGGESAASGSIKAGAK
jgi:hypothetical protein